MDCVSGNTCGGGDAPNAYTYYETAFAETEAAYPYTSGNTDHRTKCAYKQSEKTGVEVSSWAYVTENNVN